MPGVDDPEDDELPQFDNNLQSGLGLTEMTGNNQLVMAGGGAFHSDKCENPRDQFGGGAFIDDDNDHLLYHPRPQLRDDYESTTIRIYTTTHTHPKCKTHTHALQNIAHAIMYIFRIT